MHNRAAASTDSQPAKFVILTDRDIASCQKTLNELEGLGVLGESIKYDYMGADQYENEVYWFQVDHSIAAAFAEWASTYTHVRIASEHYDGKQQTFNF